jgi:hypothetical protein
MILSIYPPVNGLLDKTVSILHRTFNPNKDCWPRPPIVLMWSNVSRPRTGVTWLPNNFVPLLLTKPPEVVDMTESVEKTIQNDDPKTSTPTSNKKVKLYVICIFTQWRHVWRSNSVYCFIMFIFCNNCWACVELRLECSPLTCEQAFSGNEIGSRLVISHCLTAPHSPHKDSQMLLHDMHDSKTMYN